MMLQSYIKTFEMERAASLAWPDSGHPGKGFLLVMSFEVYTRDMSSMGRFWRTAEQKIQEAMERGEFDNLPGKGKPLHLPERNPFVSRDQQIIYQMFKDSSLVPEEVDLLKRVERLRDRLAQESKTLSEPEARAIRKQISNLEIEVRVRLERRA